MTVNHRFTVPIGNRFIGHRSEPVTNGPVTGRAVTGSDRWPVERWPINRLLIGTVNRWLTVTVASLHVEQAFQFISLPAASLEACPRNVWFSYQCNEVNAFWIALVKTNASSAWYSILSKYKDHTILTIKLRIDDNHSTLEDSLYFHFISKVALNKEKVAFYHAPERRCMQNKKCRQTLVSIWYVLCGNFKNPLLFNQDKRDVVSNDIEEEKMIYYVFKL